MKNTLLFIAAVAVTGITQAQNIFRDDFSNYIVNQELSGQGLWSSSPTAPNVGIGACVPINMSTPCFGTRVVGQSVGFLDYGFSNNSIVLAPFQDGVARAITPIITSGDLYLGLVINLTSAPTAAGSPTDFLRVINSAATDVTCRLLVRDAGFGYNVGIRKGASNNATVYTGNVYNYGENVLVILKYSHAAGADDDIVSVFVNPEYANGEPSNPNAVTTAGFDQSGVIDRVAFRMNFNVPASMPTGLVGLVSTSTTWEGLGFESLGVNEFESADINVLSILENNQVQIYSKYNRNQAKLKLYAMTGNLIEQKAVNIDSGNSKVNLSSKLSSGVYILEVEDKNGEKKSFKLIAK